MNGDYINAKTEFLFPAYLVRHLRDLRGEEWRALVDRVAELPEEHPDTLAFMLMMVELDGCLKCSSTSYKFLRGCLLCATQSVHAFKGTDTELLTMYQEAQERIRQEMPESTIKETFVLAA